MRKLPLAADGDHHRNPQLGTIQGKQTMGSLDPLGTPTTQPLCLKVREYQGEKIARARRPECLL